MIQKIAHITDMHLDEEFPYENQTSARKRFKNVLKDIKNKNISHVVCTGDIGEGKGVQFFFEQFKNTNLSITLGNHDKFMEVSKHYDLGVDYDSQKIYSSILHEYCKLIYLDSSEGIIDQKQLIWLEKELITDKPIIIFIHHPIIALNLKVDEIAERILTLGETPLHTFEDYTKAAKVPVGKNISKDEKAVELIVDSLAELLKMERSILEVAGDANDEGTNSMMSDFITEQEKTVWMMKAWLGETV